jgi:prepilin-type N-terminal cleavage/methylation domain-containing protein
MHFSRQVGARRRAGFTLSEVMIALVLVAMLCLGVFAGLQVITRLSLGTAVRSEAYRLLQAEAERLSSVDFASFTAVPDQTITSNFATSFLAGNQARLTYPSTGNAGRVAFTRRVVETASTGSTRTLRVEVQWTWQRQTSLISLPVYRTQ